MPTKLSKPLSPGDVIIKEMPLIYLLNMSSKGKYCDNCFKQSDQLKRCSKCLQMHYCGKECQKNDWKYHKNECPLLPHERPELLLSDDWLRFWVRFYLSVKKIPTFATEKHRLIDGSEVSLNDIKVDDIHVEAINGRRHEFESTHEVLAELGIRHKREEVIHWVSFFYSCDPLFPMLSFESVESDGEHIGIGLYLQHRFIGHSCQPNCAFNGNGKDLSLELRAMRPIAAGEHITLNRVPLQMNRTDRQNALNVWSMVCECNKCVHHLDRDVDYQRFGTFDLFPDRVLTSRSQLMAHVWKLLTDLDIMFGDFHPIKTVYLNVIVLNVYNCPHLTASLLNELKVRLMKAISITISVDDPQRGFFDHTFHILQFSPNALRLKSALNCRHNQ